MKHSRTLLSLIIAGAMSITALNANAADSDSDCAGEQIPQLSNVVLTCATEIGINPNQGIDLSAEISTALSDGKSIFFPAGSYLIGSDIILNEKNNLVGSDTGVTILRGVKPNESISIGNGAYSIPVSQLTIKNIIFDNAKVKFYGNKKNISIINNAFINTITAGEQLSVSHNPFTIHGNVFLRDKNHPGLGISTYRNSNTKVENNVIGDISDENILLTMNYYDVGTFNIINKIKAAAKNQQLTLLDDQGHFISGWYATDGLKNSVFRNNVISGNTLECLVVKEEKDDNKTDDENCAMGRDHVLYIKQYNNVDIVNNYFSGWPDRPSGQLKFRNASHLYFVGNYLNKTEFNARPYKSSSTLNMDNTFIFNNTLKGAMIGYWQDFSDTDDFYINSENYVVFDNLFISDDQAKKQLTATWRSTHGEYLEANNYYIDQTPVATDGFQSVNIATAKERLPAEKASLLAIKPIPLWKKVGNISGENLKDDQLVRLDIEAEGYPAQFVVYQPKNRSSYPTYRWAAELTDLFNEKIAGACAGVLTGKVTADNNCKFMAKKYSSYLNGIYTTEGGAATYTTKIVDKYLDVGYISASKIKPGQSVKFAVTFEDGSYKDVIYTPTDEYWTAGHRWPLKLAEKINTSIPGLCAGQRMEAKVEVNEISKCSGVKPILSSHLNSIYTANGQSAKIALSIGN